MIVVVPNLVVVADRSRRRTLARWLTALVSVILAAFVLAPGRAPAGTPVPGAGSCPMFPADNVWNADISGLPVDPHSAAWMASMDAATTNLHPDFGPSGDPNNPYGMPYTVVPAGHQFVSVAFQYADESDPGPYPFGPDTPIEGGSSSTGDRHAIMVDPSTSPSTNSTTPPTPRAAPPPAPVPSGTSVPTRYALPVGPRLTPPACPFSPGSCATTRWRRGASPTPSA